MARRHSENAQETTGEVVRKGGRDKPRSGSGRKVTGHEQAVTSDIAEARKEGSKGPPRAKAER